MKQKILSIETAKNGSLYVVTFLYGDGTAGRRVNDFSAETVLKCLTLEGQVAYRKGMKVTKEFFKPQEEIDLLAEEEVQNTAREPVALDKPYILCDSNGKPRMGANERPMQVTSVKVQVIWDTKTRIAIDRNTGLPMLNSKDEVVRMPLLNEDGTEKRFYRETWSPQERVESLIKARMLIPAEGEFSATTQQGQPQPNAATPDPTEVQRQTAMADLMGQQGGAQPTQPGQPGVTVPGQGQPGAPAGTMLTRRAASAALRF